MEMPWKNRLFVHGKYAAIILAAFLCGVGTPAGVDYAHRRHWTSRGKLLLFMRSEIGSTRIAKLIMRYSEQYELDPLAFMAVIWRESKFKPNAHGKRPSGYMGAGDDDRGLGGLYWVTAQHVAETVFKDKALARKIKASPAVLYEPDLNLDITAANLRRLLDHHKSVHDIWDAYMFHNSGDEGKGSLENVTAVKDRYHHYRRKLERFNWRKAR
jgi:hypothetical protein